jgi:hypothetical protein
MQKNMDFYGRRKPQTRGTYRKMQLMTRLRQGYGGFDGGQAGDQ